MITPINPNKIQPATTERGTQADETKGRKAAAGSSAPSGTAATSTVNDTLDIDKASALYRHANTRPVSDSTFDSPEAAMELTLKIAQQLKENGADGLLAQAGTLSNNVGVLLEVAPA